MAVGDIRSNDVMAVVDDIARTAPTTADRVQTVISSVLTYAVREQIIPYNPARGIPRRAADIPRDRFLHDGELRALLRELDHERVLNSSYELYTILRLLLLTGARSSEVRLAEQGDLHWDGYAAYQGPVWVVPGNRLSKGRVVRGRTKSGRPKVLPLSTKPPTCSPRPWRKPASAPEFSTWPRAAPSLTPWRGPAGASVSWASAPPHRMIPPHSRNLARRSWREKRSHRGDTWPRPARRDAAALQFEPVPALHRPGHALGASSRYAQRGQANRYW